LNSPILKKITLVILLISLGSILTSGMLINYALNRQFQSYLSQAELTRQEQSVKILADIYQANGGWRNFPLGREFFAGSLRYVTDSTGQVVMITRRAAMDPDDQRLLNPLPIYVQGRKVGTAYFGRHPLQNFLTRQDELFHSTINRSIFLSILITGVISLLVAIIFARKLSAPITEMNQIAKNMTAGNLDTRIQNLPHDELGELGNSLNRLTKRLKHVEELRKKMTADVAHDLRTPLTTVRSHLEGMIDTVIPPSPENLESLLEEINRLSSLVEDLQAIAVTDAAVQQFKIEPVALDPFLKDVKKRITPLYQAKGVILGLEKFSPVTLQSDREALTKIFENLLSNAYKYTPAGKKVLIGVEPKENTVSITVRDQGIGISETDLPFIFERFYRTDQSRSRESGGFGLGLTIVKELVEALGGTVNVTSQLGEGTVFKISFPS
jgi:two-component system, OmpR family, sensor histidine kinase BaeS